MKRIIVIFLVQIFFICAYSQNAKQFYKAGVNFKKSSNYKDAIEQFSKAIATDPDYVDAYVERADVYEKLKQYSEAAKDYERALVFDDDNAEIYYNASITNYLIGEYSKASGFLDKCLEKKKSYIEAHELRAKVMVMLGEYNKALEATQKALSYRDNAYNHYYTGIVYEKLKNYGQAESEYEKAIAKDKFMVDAYLALSKLRLQLNKLDNALAQCNSALSIDKNNREGYLIRSKIYIKKMDYPKAINDVSRNLLTDQEDKEMYFVRGTYYQDFAQHQNAINDFNKVLILDDSCAEAYYKRAYSYEQIANFKDAIKDYKKLSELSKNDTTARGMLTSAKERLFELNRERNNPQIVLIDPVPIEKSIVKMAKNKDETVILGRIIDESEIKSFQINGVNILFNKGEEFYEFMANLNVSSLESLNLTAEDVYGNIQNTTFTIERTEIDKPVIAIIAPYASDNNEIFLDSDDPDIYLEGKIADESLIKSILIDGVTASFKVDELNPKFSATISINNKNKFTVRAVDIYGNESINDFTLNREGATLLEKNPMGRTWVVFIENSNYENFPSLDGPEKDVSVMRSALARYDIHKIIHKKDMDKKAMERFFSIELRDLVRSNRVNSILLWYAGHGKFINETGYWIPVDARRDDEFTYYNINALRASLQSYSNAITHTLVITDACESGPTFFQAMRETLRERSCNDWKAISAKSSQVFSSAGYELAVDNSQFTKTFANTLSKNPASCLPIESVVFKVLVAVESNKQQKPKFGKISGLEDEDGTFFFISKE